MEEKKVTQTLADDDIQDVAPSRRSALGAIGAAIATAVVGAVALSPSRAEACRRTTGRNDSDPTDGAGHGRTGVNDSDSSDEAACGRGRRGNTGRSDSDPGDAAGRGGRRCSDSDPNDGPGRGRNC
ncbi:MAG: twin-arginine translocation signal domain-containing protein [Polyangiales bacterium]